MAPQAYHWIRPMLTIFPTRLERSLIVLPIRPAKSSSLRLEVSKRIEGPNRVIGRQASRSCVVGTFTKEKEFAVYIQAWSKALQIDSQSFSDIETKHQRVKERLITHTGCF